jgi:hypothetical protein
VAVQVEPAGPLHIRCGQPDLPAGLENSAEFAQQREEFTAQFEVFNDVLNYDGGKALVRERESSRRQVHIELAGRNIDIDKPGDTTRTATQVQVLGPGPDSTRHAASRTGSGEIKLHELPSSFGAREREETENGSEQ